MGEKLRDRDPFATTVAHRKSDVEFHDVFGGPPRRRSSMHERHQGRADSFDVYSSARGREEILGSRRQWSGSGEKPVFGELNSPARRRQVGEDFYSDIFPGSDSSGSTPKRAERDVYGSTPGSRVLSPNRAGPIRYESIAGGSSLPSQISLSMRFSKGTDHSTISSPTQPGLYRNEDRVSDSFSFPSSPNQSIPSSRTNLVGLTQDDPRGDIHSPFRRNSLSRLNSQRRERNSTNSTNLKESEFKRSSASLESYVNSCQFHFSFYRWAGKGVSLKFPRISKEDSNINDMSAIRGLPEVVIQGVDFSTDDDESMTYATDVSKIQVENDERIEDSGSVNMDDFNESVQSDITDESGTSREKFKVKNLQELLMDDFVKQGSDSSGKKVGEKTNVKSKKQADSRVKGKVKEFIKIFNYEGSPKQKGIPDYCEIKPKRKIKSKSKAESQVRDSDYSKANQESKATEMNISDAFATLSSVMKQVQEKKEEQVSSTNINAKRIDDYPLEQNQTFEQYFESNYKVPDTTTTSNEINHDESHIEDFEECLIEHSIEDQHETSQNDSDQDQIKISESKIRQWSKGKEGNIRSLLSTLQYVLWPESGWKPVPLMDIIEGQAVKRAYQKALLCLHPDKLQQRGAAPHHKYMAEKVFDILQDAWNQFVL